MPELILGVDLAGAIVRLVVVDGAGQVLARSEAAPQTSPATWVRDAAGRVVATAGGRVAAVGVTTIGTDPIPGGIAESLRDCVPGASELHTVGAGVATALAEAWCGAARGLRHVMTFSIAEHVHAGLLIGGVPWSGAHGAAASVGWLALNPVEREDYRRYGGLEAEVASAGIVRRFVWRIKSGDESSLADRVAGDFSKITVDDIFRASREGDGVSVSVVRDTARYIGMAVANIATLIDPEIIVLGGVIAIAGDTMLDAIRIECARRIGPQHAEQVRLELSTLGPDAAAIGAARAAASVRA